MSNAEMIRYWNESAAPAWTRFEERARCAARAARRARARARATARWRARARRRLRLRRDDARAGRGRRRRRAASSPSTSRARCWIARAASRERASELADAHRVRGSTTRRPRRSKPGGFDLVFSRFGVMFFADPVAAFANLRRALRRRRPARVRVLAAAREEPVDARARARRGAARRVSRAAAAGRAGPVRVRRRRRACAGSSSDAGFADVALEALNGPMRLAGDTSTRRSSCSCGRSGRRGAARGEPGRRSSARACSRRCAACSNGSRRRAASRRGGSLDRVGDGEMSDRAMWIPGKDSNLN